MMSIMSSMISMSMPAIQSALVNAGATLFVGYGAYWAYNEAISLYTSAIGAGASSDIIYFYCRTSIDVT